MVFFSETSGNTESIVEDSGNIPKQLRATAHKTWVITIHVALFKISGMSLETFSLYYNNEK